MTRHIVQLSSGTGSWLAATRVVERFGADSVLGLFADVASSDPERPWWDGEDPDNYRFLAESTASLGIGVVTVSDGRGVWGLNRAQNMIANSRVPFCSRILKYEPCVRWLAKHCDPAATVLYVGIDWTEVHRCEPIATRWAKDGWQVVFPLIDEAFGPPADKNDAVALLEQIGISPPRMYAEGFRHANCSGFCSRMGNAQAAHLLATRPEVFAGHEANETAFRASTGKNATVLVTRKGGTRRPYSLADLRVDVERGSADSPPLFGDDEWSCGCTDGEPEIDAETRSIICRLVAGGTALSVIAEAAGMSVQDIERLAAAA